MEWQNAEICTQKEYKFAFGANFESIEAGRSRTEDRNLNDRALELPKSSLAPASGPASELPSESTINQMAREGRTNCSINVSSSWGPPLGLLVLCVSRMRNSDDSSTDCMTFYMANRVREEEGKNSICLSMDPV